MLFWIAFGFFAYGAYFYWMNDYPWYTSLSSLGLAIVTAYLYYKHGIRKYMEK